MLKEREKYVDFNGVEREEDFYFHLTKAEIVLMEFNTKGGFEQMVKNIIDAKEEGRLASIIEELLLKAYGKKSPDGRTFDKSEEISNEFKHTMAYSNIFIRLVSDANYTAKWIESVISEPTAQKETVPSIQPVTE